MIRICLGLPPLPAKLDKLHVARSTKPLVDESTKLNWTLNGPLNQPNCDLDTMEVTVWTQSGVFATCAEGKWRWKLHGRWTPLATVDSSAQNCLGTTKIPTFCNIGNNSCSRWTLGLPPFFDLCVFCIHKSNLEMTWYLFVKLTLSIYDVILALNPKIKDFLSTLLCP